VVVRSFSHARPRFAAGIIALVAFFVRLLHVLSYEAWPTNDMAVYIDMAVRRLSLPNLFTAEGLCWFPPGYSFFLKPFFLAFAPETALLGVRIAQAMLGAITCVLIYRLTVRVHSRRAGLVAAAITCFYPHFLFYSSAYMSENLFIPLYLASLTALLHAADRGGAWRLYRAGLIVGATVLVRPAAVTLAPALCLAAWRGARASRAEGDGTQDSRQARLRSLRSLGVILAGGLTVIAPWAIRNRIAYGHLVVIAPNGAFNLAVGNDADATGRYTEPPSISGNIWSRMEHFQQVAAGFVTNDPWGALFVVTHLKWPAFWEMIPPWPLYSSNPQLFAGELFLPFLTWRVVFVSGLVGLGVTLARRKKDWWVTPGCFAAYAGFYMLYFGNSRFRMPAEAYFLIWAGVAVASSLRFIPARARMRAPVWAAVIGVAMTLVLGQSALVAAGSRAFSASPASFLASGEQIPVLPGKPPDVLLGGPIALDRALGHYLRLEFNAFRQGPTRDTPENGHLQITFLDRTGVTLPWLDNPKYFLEAIPPDRWARFALKAHIPPSANSCRVVLTHPKTSPDTLLLDQLVLRYSKGNDLALEFLFPYLRYNE